MGCKRDLLLPSASQRNISIAEAKQYFEANLQTLKPNTLSSTSAGGNSTGTNNEKVPMWDASQLRVLSIGTNAVFTPLHRAGVYVHISDKRMVKYGFLNYMMMRKDAQNNIITEWVELKPSEKWIDAKTARKYDGKIFIRNWDGKLKRVLSFNDGVRVAIQIPKINKLASIDGARMTGDGDINCFVTTTTTVTTIPGIRCSCDLHEWGQMCNCPTPPTRGSTMVAVDVQYDCDMPDDPDGPSGGTGNSGGEGPLGNSGGGTGANDYTPPSCNPDPNYTVPLEEAPPGTEWVLPCSETEIPTDPTQNPTGNPTGNPQAPVQAPASYLIGLYNITDLGKIGFLNQRPALAAALKDYLARENTQYSIEYGDWLLDYLFNNPSANFHDFIDANEFSGMYTNLHFTELPFTDANISDIPTDAIFDTPRLIGTTGSRGNTEDLTFGTNGDTQGILSLQLGKNDALLFSDMEDLFDWLSIGTLETVAHQFINRFRDRTGGTMLNADLNLEVKKSDSYKRFLSRFRNDLETHIKNSGGVISNAGLPALGYHPVFDGWTNRLSGLQILINDTEETEIKLLAYKTDLTTQTWIADVEVVILDHFGLDRHDALAFQGEDRGFAAWWVLQHRRNYPPFITKIIVRNRLTGKL
jgi:hypothetical protein